MAGALQRDGSGVGGQLTQIQANLQDNVQHYILNF